MLALPLQMIFYPYLVYKAASTGGGLHEWLGGGWEVGTEAAFWDRWEATRRVYRSPAAGGAARLVRKRHRLARSDSAACRLSTSVLALASLTKDVLRRPVRLHGQGHALHARSLDGGAPLPVRRLGCREPLLVRWRADIHVRHADPRGMQILCVPGATSPLSSGIVSRLQVSDCATRTHPQLGSCSVNLTMLLESHKAWTVYRKLMSFASLVIITVSHVVAFWCTYVFAYGRDDAVTGAATTTLCLPVVCDDEHSATIMLTPRMRVSLCDRARRRGSALYAGRRRCALLLRCHAHPAILAAKGGYRGDGQGVQRRQQRQEG